MTQTKPMTHPIRQQLIRAAVLAVSLLIGVAAPAAQEESQALSDRMETVLRHFDGDRYVLGEHVVMPNHVHAIVSPVPGVALSDILHSWKSYSAKRINQMTGRSGRLWQHESFDHIVRNPKQLERISAYIRDNPKGSGR